MFINNAGLSLELHYIDGNPEGMLTAEVFNWTGHVLKNTTHSNFRSTKPT